MQMSHWYMELDVRAFLLEVKGILRVLSSSLNLFWLPLETEWPDHSPLKIELKDHRILLLAIGCGSMCLCECPRESSAQNLWADNISIINSHKGLFVSESFSFTSVLSWFYLFEKKIIFQELFLEENQFSAFQGCNVSSECTMENFLVLLSFP